MTTETKNSPKPAHASDRCHELRNLIQDVSLSAADRGDILNFSIAEAGLDYRPVVQELIAQADRGRLLMAKAEEAEKTPLVSERFLGRCIRAPNLNYAIVTRGHQHIMLPAEPETLNNYRIGDPVLVDLKQERIVGSDGSVPLGGEVVAIESLPPDREGYIVVKHHDRRPLAVLHQDLRDQPELCQPDMEVLYDPVTNFAIASMKTTSNGDELLVNPAQIEAVRRSDVGGIKPVVDEILDRFRMSIHHPEWIREMQARPRCSYLFTGQTGSGKSYHVKLIANEIHDVVEEFTGARLSRLVTVDASDFWVSLFGETEQRVARWADRLRSLGSQLLRGRNGQPVAAPLLVVLEEAEALLRGRGDQASGHLFDRPLALLLQKTESLESALQVPIIWVATSNRADLIDAAALRRLGMRQVTFGSLRANEALAVLKTKIAHKMPICGGDADRFVQQLMGYLYGPQPKQAIAEVRLGNSERRTLNRGDVVTPAVMEEAVSYGIDRCLRKSHRAGRLLGLDAADVIAFLHRHFASLARTIRPHNLAEHATEWFDRERPQVIDIVPLTDERLPHSLF